MSIAWLTITLEDGFRVVPAKNLRTGTSRDSRERAARAPRAHLTEFRSRAKRPVPERGKHGTGLSAGARAGRAPRPGPFRPAGLSLRGRSWAVRVSWASAPFWGPSRIRRRTSGPPGDAGGGRVGGGDILGENDLGARGKGYRRGSLTDDDRHPGWVGRRLPTREVRGGPAVRQLVGAGDVELLSGRRNC